MGQFDYDQPDYQLLTHLVSRLTDRVEDVAVEALGFILDQSEKAREAVGSITHASHESFGDLNRAETQVTLSDEARPDVVVYDGEDEKRVIIEAKFWAGLTESQQQHLYLKHLPRDPRPSALLFVAPETRLDSLWRELLDVKTLQSRLSGERNDQGAVRWTGLKKGGRFLMLTSWRNLLAEIFQRLDSHDPMRGNVQQLRALCERQDRARFLPITSGEFAPSIPRRLLQLNRLIDHTVDSAVQEEFANIDGLKATPQKYGYGRYLWLGHADRRKHRGSAWFGVDFRKWSRYQDTPLWLNFYEWGPKSLSLPELRIQLSDPEWFGEARNSLPVRLMQNVEYDVVVDGAVTRLRTIAEQLTAQT